MSVRNADSIQAIGRGQLFFYCDGFIEFTNVFDARWRLNFSQKWEYLLLGSDPEFLIGRWVSCGDADANSEYQVA